MKAATIVLLLSLFGIATGLSEVPQDAEARKLILGSWISSRPAEDGGGGITFRPDGTFSGDASFESADRGKLKVRVEGKWRIEDGILIEELTKSTHPNFIPVGLITRDKLLELGRKGYRYQTEHKTEGRYNRAPKAEAPDEKKALPRKD